MNDTPTATIPLMRPLLGEEEEQAVLAVLRSGQLVQGPMVACFESELAALTERKHGIAVSSGTAALRLSLLALGVGPGDEVLCPDLTWPSPAHAIIEVGATPRLVDVDESTWNVSATALQSARTPRCRAAIVIDQFGFPADMPAIAAALPELPLIVDAACSLGSTLGAQPCGSFGAIACMSFHPRKIITTGEGGICLTDDAQLAAQLQSLRNHGQAAPGQFACAAGNARLGEMNAAMGRSQLARLPLILQTRRALGAYYRAALPGYLRPQASCTDAVTNFQTFGVVIHPQRSDLTRDGLISALSQKGIQAGRLSYALHALPQLAHLAPPQCTASQAALIADRGLCLPLYTHMTTADQDRVLSVLRAFA